MLYMRRDHVTIDRLHSEMNLISLEQRRNVQLLKLMYLRSEQERYVKKLVRVLWGNVKVKFKLMSRCTGKYMNSPMFRGSALWDALPVDIQRVVTIRVFTKELCNMNKTYVDLLSLIICMLCYIEYVYCTNVKIPHHPITPEDQSQSLSKFRNKRII